MRFCAFATSVWPGECITSFVPTTTIAIRGGSAAAPISSRSVQVSITYFLELLALIAWLTMKNSYGKAECPVKSSTQFFVDVTRIYFFTRNPVDSDPFQWRKFLAGIIRKMRENCILIPMIRNYWHFIPLNYNICLKLP